MLDDLRWSPSEKKLARQAYLRAYEKECSTIMGRAKSLIENATGPRDIWLVHDYLTKQRRDTDQKYDYRYSKLIFVFARLLSEGWMSESDLQGLGEDKIAHIKSILKLNESD